MNRRMIGYTVGRLILLEAVLLLLPLAVGLVCADEGRLPLLITVAVAAVVGGGLMFFRPKEGKRQIFARGGFVCVALSWVFLSLIGALPFTLAGKLSYVDAFFETVSGLTTTGSSVMADPAVLCKSLLFWRSFTHWIGGMGVIVLIMAILPTDSGRSMHIMRAEMPGPIVGKLVPRIRDTAKILYLIYFALTALETALLTAGGESLFNSLLYAFGTAGTGGFGINAAGIGGCSAYSQWVIAVFMLLFGVNFNLYYLLLLRRFRTALGSRELWVYGSIVAVAAVIVGCNVYHLYSGLAETARVSVFQVASIVTTTGYSTVDFNQWPMLSRTLIVLLMFLGGCAGSTAGGLKVSRVMLLFKIIRRDVYRMLHPRSVSAVKLEGKAVDDVTLSGVGAYFALYIICMMVILLLLSFNGFDLETNITATISCFNNIGPGLGRLIGPTGNFSAYSGFSKVVLSFAMLFGRLEIYPMLIALSPSTWKEK